MPEVAGSSFPPGLHGRKALELEVVERLRSMLLPRAARHLREVVVARVVAPVTVHPRLVAVKVAQAKIVSDKPRLM